LKVETEELFEAFTLLRNTGEVQDFLTDLMTPSEIESLAVRWQNMKLLMEGFSRKEIQAKTGASLTTISRCRRVVIHGTGMIRVLMERLGKSHLLDLHAAKETALRGY
jgi:TrpR-related protein YerC/YecD